MKWPDLTSCFKWCACAREKSRRRNPTQISEIEVTDDEMESLRAHFSSCDTNNDGFISKSELSELMRLLRQEDSEERLEAIVKSIDINKDGLVSFEEFTILYKRLKKASAGQVPSTDVKADAHNAFKVFDRDDDGYITLPEIKLVMSYLGENVDEEKALQMLKMADTNQDGKISEQEFLSVFNSIASGEVGKISSNTSSTQSNEMSKNAV